MLIADKPVLEAPPLESGDRLTRVEFERRYETMPEIKKAELIEGVVYMPSPARFRQHAQPHAQIMTWLGVYGAATPGVQVGDNATVRLDLDNEAQPDALLRLARGGKSHLGNDDYLEGAPELIAEIAASSASYDLHDKLKVYRRNGVQEYLVWQRYEKRLDWFQLRDTGYLSLAPDEAGVLHSQVFPGLRLVVAALLAGNVAQVLAVLQQGLDSAEHKAFVDRLARAGTA
ncbi:MAG: Uma2 family endonuclease [Truepera sp.]|nr:Uma2 family endonuclease [Truepera sp.]